jgi:hypothetical protein
LVSFGLPDTFCSTAMAAPFQTQRPSRHILQHCYCSALPDTFCSTAMAAPFQTHSAALLWQRPSRHILQHCYGSTLPDTFCSTAMAAPFQTHSAALLWQRPSTSFSTQFIITVHFLISRLRRILQRLVYTNYIIAIKRTLY